MQITKILICFCVFASLASTGQEIEWNLAEVTQEAARDIQKVYQQGGDEPVIKAIRNCHANLIGSTALSTATARCYTLDMAGTLLAYKKYKETNGKLNPFFKESGNFIIRGVAYFSEMERAEAENAMYIIQKNILLAIPELDKK